MEDTKLSRTEQLNRWKKVKEIQNKTVSSREIKEVKEAMKESMKESEIVINKDSKIKSKPLSNIYNTVNNINKLNNISITTDKILGKRNLNKECDKNEKKIKINNNNNNIKNKIEVSTKTLEKHELTIDLSEIKNDDTDMDVDTIKNINIEGFEESSEQSTEGSKESTPTPNTVEEHVANLDSNQTSLLLAQAVMKIQSIQHDYATLSDNSNKLVIAYNELFEAYEKEKESKTLLSIFLKCAQAEAKLVQEVPSQTVPPKSLPKAVFQPFDDSLLKSLEDSSVIAGLESEVTHLNHNLAAVRFAYSINAQKLEEVQALNRTETSELNERLLLKEEEIEELNKSVDTIQSQISWAMDASLKKLSEKEEEIEELKAQLLALKK